MEEMETAVDLKVCDQEETTHVMQQVRNKRKITFSLVFAAVTCFAGGSLQFGFNLAVINAPSLVIANFFKDVPNFKHGLWPLAVSLFAIGGVIGAFSGPHIASKIGRKTTMFVNNFIAILGGVLLCSSKFADSVAVLMLGRIIVGINAGMNTSVSPMYITEIAPVNLRGALGTLNQFGIVTGILFANVLGLNEVLGTEKGWPFLFGMTVVIAILQLFCLPFCPESPRYLLLIANDEPGAERALKRLRGIKDVSEEVEEIKLEAARAYTQSIVTVIELVCDQQYKKPLMISIVMQLSQQLSGIGGILYYSTELFNSAGMSPQKSQLATCGTGALSVLMTALVVVLIEVKGRKFLMLLGLGGMAAFSVVTTVAFVLQTQHYTWATYIGVISVLISLTFFMSGPGAVPWFIVAELFTQASVSAAMSICAPINWLSNFAVGLLFPVMHNAIYPYTFLPFAAILVPCWLFTFFMVPETKGLTVEQISKQLNSDNNANYDTILNEDSPNENTLFFPDKETNT